MTLEHGSWFTVHGAALHGSWNPDHGALPDPGAQIILELPQRSPGALDHGAIPWVLLALDPGSLVHGSWTNTLSSGCILKNA